MTTETRAFSAANGHASHGEHDRLLVPGAALARALDLAAELAGDLRSLHLEALTEHSSIEVLRRQIGQLEDQIDRNEARREQLMAALVPLADDEKLQTLVALLGAWTQRPNDLLVIVKLAEQSSFLAAAIEALQKVQEILLAD